MELLVPYVRDSDTVVDMCCGSNDFSVMLKRRLGQAGKKECKFRNYDIMQPKVGGEDVGVGGLGFGFGSKIRFQL